MAQRVRKHHPQKGRRGLAVIAPSRKATQPPNALPQRHGGSKDVRGPPKRQPIHAQVPNVENHRRDKAAVKNPARLERRPTENLAWIVAVITPFRQNHQHLGAQQAHHDQPCAQVEKAPGLKPLLPAEARHRIHRRKNPQHQQHAVGGHMKRTEFNQDRMQTSLPRRLLKNPPKCHAERSEASRTALKSTT